MGYFRIQYETIMGPDQTLKDGLQVSPFSQANKDQRTSRHIMVKL